MPDHEERIAALRTLKSGAIRSHGSYLATGMHFSVAGSGEAFRTLMLGDAYRRQLHPHSRFTCHNRFRTCGWQLLPVEQERSKSPGVDGNIDWCDAADLSDAEGLSLAGSNLKVAGLLFFMVRPAARQKPIKHHRLSSSLHRGGAL